VICWSTGTSALQRSTADTPCSQAATRIAGLDVLDLEVAPIGDDINFIDIGAQWLFPQGRVPLRSRPGCVRLSGRRNAIAEPRRQAPGFEEDRLQQAGSVPRLSSPVALHYEAVLDNR